MELKDLATLLISVTALALSAVSLLRTRANERIARRQTLVEMKYEALLLNDAQQLQMVQLLVRLQAIDKSRFHDDITSMKELLVTQLESARERAERLARISAAPMTPNHQISMREIVGLLTLKKEMLSGLEARMNTLESTSKEHMASASDA